MNLKYFFLIFIQFCSIVSFSQNTCTSNTGSVDAKNNSSWSCDGTINKPSDATGGEIETVIVPNGSTLTISNKQQWYSNVVVQNGGKIIFENQLYLGTSANCGFTFIIENGGTIDESGSGANDRLYICGNTIISSQPNPPATAVDWPSGGFTGPTGFDEDGEDSTLPVELLYLNATIEVEHVVLKWATASELNNDYFTLEKSKNGKQFELTTEVKGNGTTSEKIIYQYIDTNPHLGLSYYRLSQTDYDGTTEAFPLISVLFNPGKSIFTISPNPIENQSITLKATGNMENELVELNILDLNGKLIENKYLHADQFGNIETDIQLRNQLKKGTYIFELISESRKVNNKIVVE